MARILGFLSGKIPDRAKTSALLSAELRIHLFSLSMIILCMEAFLLIAKGDPAVFPRGAFVLAAFLFFFLFSLLAHTFSLFVSGRTASLFSLLTAALLFLPMQKTKAPLFLCASVIAAAAAGLFFTVFPHREKLMLYGVFVLDAMALCLYFGANALHDSPGTDKALFIVLAVLTLASVQEILFENVLSRKGGSAFPFFYFALLAVIVAAVPMRQEPIDWTPVAEAGGRMIRKAADIADSVSYHLSSVWGGGSYTAGYSSLDGTGGTLERSDRTQIILGTAEKPYYVYKDEDTSADMKVRRTILLAGGRGVDKPQLVRFLSFLHAGGVDREFAALFSHVSDIDVEYDYLDTSDEIAPAGSLLLRSVSPRTGGSTIENGVSSARHKKGYKIHARYLDIDYGSPYLIGLFRKAGEAPRTSLSYADACGYFKELYGVDLGGILTKDEYEEAADADPASAFLDTDGVSERMKKLADELTGGAHNEYDACRLVERYLRQYAYRTDAVGGHDPRSDMSTSYGMADIADRFLFETGAGYCVHYTSSMVMLLRLAGIPARAVSGYRYVFPFTQADAYEVSGNCAHVWPEAYLENAGWVPFEPTAAYRTAADYTWHRRSETADAAEEVSSVPDPAIPQAPGAADEEVEAGLPASDQTAQTAPDPASLFVKLALPAATGILVLLAALFLGSFAAERLRYMRGTPETKLIMDVEMIKKGIRRESSEDFADRGLLSDYTARSPHDLRSDIQKVFDAYYRVIYGNTGNTGVTGVSGNREPNGVNGSFGNAGVTAEENALAARLRDELKDRSRRNRSGH